MKFVFAGLLVVIAVSVGGLLVSGQSSTNPSQTQTESSQVLGSEKSEEQSKSVFTMLDVESHGDSTSCWAAIDGKVYDLTGWISQHPGGPGRIISICGTDASQAFNAQHAGQERPESELAKFSIGDLAN